MCRECGWGMWMGIPGGAEAAGLPSPCKCSGPGKGEGAQPQTGAPVAAQLCSSASSAASARRGKQGCSDTEQGFVRSREPRLGRNPKMRFAIKPRSGKQGWWRIRRCHSPASASGRGKRENHALARGSPSPEPRWDGPGAGGDKWGCWEQDRRRDSGIAADLEPEGTGKWGDGGGSKGEAGVVLLKKGGVQ